jgi:hypothetical protein
MDARAVTVALAIWEGRISPVFEVSREIVILRVENGVVVERRGANLDVHTAERRIARLLDLGVHTLICGAISAPLRLELMFQGVRALGSSLAAPAWTPADGEPSQCRRSRRSIPGGARAAAPVSASARPERCRSTGRRERLEPSRRGPPSQAHNLPGGLWGRCCCALPTPRGRARSSFPSSASRYFFTISTMWRALLSESAPASQVNRRSRWRSSRSRCRRSPWSGPSHRLLRGPEWR